MDSLTSLRFTGSINDDQEVAMSTQMKELTLVAGGTGKTGRRVVEQLRARGLPVRVGSRRGDPAFDWDDQATWAPVLRGATSAYLSFYPDLAVPGAAATVSAFAELAVESGVRRLVLLSGRGEEEAERTERAVRELDTEWTIVRCSWFSQNFSEGAFLEAILAGEAALPVDGIGEPFLDAEDVADVAVAALTEHGHAKQLYELTGPRLLRFDEAIEEIARASGRPVRFVPVPVEEYAAALASFGVSDDEVALITYLFTEVLDGRNAHLTDGVRRALGRDPRDFRDYVRRTAAAGVWAPEAVGASGSGRGSAAQ
jgi:uncharacterized protein YbjT (DUF2867 family)